MTDSGNRLFMGPTKSGGQSEAEHADDRANGAAPHAPPQNCRHSKDENTLGVAAAVRHAAPAKRQRAEGWLRSNGKATRDMVECTSDALFFVDRQGYYQYANRRASQLLGYTYDQLVSMSIVETTPDADQAKTRRLFRQLQRTGTMRCELLLKHRNGGIVPVDFSATLLPDGAVFVACRDICDNPSDKAALKRSEEFKEAVLNSVFSAIAVLDYHGNIIAVNEAWRRFALGNGGQNTQLGVNYLHICRACLGDGQDDARQAHDGIVAVLEGRLLRFCLEYPCHSPDQQRWFSMSVTPFKRRGRGVVITHTDVTAAKLAEQERSRQRDALVREVHHRIKNNLQGVAGLLQRELGKFSERDPRLQAAISQVDAIAIVHGLQGINSGEAILLSECVKNICRTIAKLSHRSLPFHRDDKQGVLRSAWVDNAEVVALALILNELILNAVKHSPEDALPPTVILQTSGTSVQVVIRNATRGTTAFNNKAGQGLRLVQSLMPKRGASLAYELDAPGMVLTKLTLSPPLLALCPKQAT